MSYDDGHITADVANGCKTEEGCLGWHTESRDPVRSPGWPDSNPLTFYGP